MSLITAIDLWKSYGTEDVLQGISLSIPPQARIALLGANGIGKTTLLKLLVGEETPTSGKIQRARNLTIGYLPQVRFSAPEDMNSSSPFPSVLGKQVSLSTTLWDYCLSALQELLDLEQELSLIAKQIAEQAHIGDNQYWLEKYSKLQHLFETRGGYDYLYQTRQVLQGLGFNEQDYSTPLEHLSSGQRTRAMLAHLLLLNPSLLILDEPTNHLDIQAVQWLEGFLSNWKGSLLLVSHDRYFLDKVCNVIWDMFADHIEVYHGNYSAFLEQRELRWQSLQNNFKAEIERLEKELAYVRRNIAAQNTAQAKGKLRRLSRQIEAIEQLGWVAVQQKNWLQVSQQVNTSQSMMSVEEAERRLRALTPPQDDRQPYTFKLHLKPQSRSGDIVLRSAGVLVGYPNKPLFYTEEILLRRKECAALIGANGSGKTTFLKTILQQIPPLQGEVQLGASLRIGYFAQTHDDLNPECSLVKEIEALKPDWSPLQVRKHLARFLFFGDDVYKPIKVLSGGERSRLVLAKLALTEANFLLLDEPTNHLDIPSQELLQTVLAEYSGTILLVSHDRFLINLLATQLWVIKPSLNSSLPKLEVFNGSYHEYLQRENSLSEQQPLPASQEAKEAKEKRIFQVQKAQKNRLLSITRKKQARREELEAIIEKLEAEEQELEEALANPPSDYQAVQQLGERYTRCKAELEEAYHEWTQLIEE